MKNLERFFGLAIKFYLISGGLGVLYYFLQSGNVLMLMICVLVYLFSYYWRRFITHSYNNSTFTEVGIAFVSILFIGYGATMLKLDSGIEQFLPDQLLVQTSLSFLFLILMFYLSYAVKNKWVVTGILIAAVYFVKAYQSAIVISPEMARLIIGAPIIYLASILIGFNYSPGMSKNL